MLYSDELIDMARAIGTVLIGRASRVEPDTSGRWTADMAPVNGPVLGPFGTRQEALEREAAWLVERGVPFPEGE